MILFSGNQLSAQTQTPLDSLLSSLENETIDSLKLKTQIRIIKKLYKTDTKKANLYADSIFTLAKKSKHKDKQIKILATKAAMLYRTRHRTQAIEAYSSLKAIYQTNNNFKGVAKQLETIGKLYFLEIDYSSALSAFFKADSIARKNGLTQQTASIKNRLGDLYFAQENYQAAIASHKTCLALLDSFSSKGAELTKATAHNRLGTIYKDIQKYDSATFHHNKVKQIGLKYNNKSFLAHTYNNLGIIHRKTKNLPAALENYNAALKIYKTTKNRKGEAGALINIGKVLVDQKKYNQAIKYLLKGNKITENIGAQNYSLVAYEGLADAYEGLGKYKKSNSYLKKYRLLNDSLLTQNKNKVLTEMQVKYDSQKIENENNVLKKDLRIADLEVSEKSKKELLYMLLISFLAN